jgi:IS30 family transposase
MPFVVKSFVRSDTCANSLSALDQDKVAAALKLVSAGLSPTAAARELGLGRSTVYREVRRAAVEWPRGDTAAVAPHAARRAAARIA